MWTPFTQRRWLYKTVTFVWTSVIFLKGVVRTPFTQKGMFRFFYPPRSGVIFRGNFSKLVGIGETVTFVWTPFTQSSMFLPRKIPTFSLKMFSKDLSFWNKLAKFNKIELQTVLSLQLKNMWVQRCRSQTHAVLEKNIKLAKI